MRENSLCPQEENYQRTVLIQMTDDNVYALGDLLGLPSCVLSVSGGRGFPYDQLLVTPYEINGNANSVKKFTQAAPFMERSSKLIWRGTVKFDPTHSRVKLMQLYERLVKRNETWLQAANGQTGISMKNQCSMFRYHIDIGGLSGTTWSGLRWKLDCGSLLFKVDSAVGSKDWWHQYLIPHQHYIPIDPGNLESDLRKWFLWAEANPAKAQDIANAGKKVARWTASAEARRDQMLTAFYNSCTPDLEEYRQYKEHCDSLNEANR